MEDCIHVEYDADGPQCKIDACKGFQCRHRFGEDCGHYEPKEDYQNACETKLEDYTLKDIKRICERNIDCTKCPLFKGYYDESLCILNCCPQNWDW